MEKSVQQFRDIQPQLRKNEVWRHVDFSDMLNESLLLPTGERQTAQFHCNIPNLDTHRFATENGFCHLPSVTTDQGIVLASLRNTANAQPQLVSRQLGSCTPKANPYLQFNTDNYTDGVFVQVPANTFADKPIQVQSVINAGHGLFLQVRNLIVVGRNSHVAIIHCDDSYDTHPAFSNNVTEIVVEEGAQVEYYKMQNLNNNTGLLNHTYVSMAQGSSFRSVAITLNGGHIRNHTEVRMLGEHCQVQAHGLYLNDQEQRVDNYIFVDHACPNCTSHELYKGILDDSAQGTFNGHVLVRDGAVKTEAYQTNKNILLTDKAFINTKPFLEIYNDDVKCSHGSTIGQLDEQALFYIRSRGISERTARTLLSYAFCDEVLQQIMLPTLRDNLIDLVKKRLHGELTPCSECSLQCSTPCNGPDVNFYIDPEKL
ncbi:MAG: Fe-S cluster assembly protein SufD [Bacteroidales bacterium]|nr:Fe-S cluster assembly protein SufD [Bacteroidales bacterium]